MILLLNVLFLVCHVESLTGVKYQIEQTYDSTVWPSLVLQEEEAKTNIECASQCKVSSVNCMMFALDNTKTRCYLADPFASSGVIPPQTYSLAFHLSEGDQSKLESN